MQLAGAYGSLRQYKLTAGDRIMLFHRFQFFQILRRDGPMTSYGSVGVIDLFTKKEQVFFMNVPDRMDCFPDLAGQQIRFDLIIT